MTFSWTRLRKIVRNRVTDNEEEYKQWWRRAGKLEGHCHLKKDAFFRFDICNNNENVF